jgi:tetratricopeptide (TPR) repeat protein
MFLPELNEAQKKSKEPIPLGSPQSVLYEATIKLPEGIKPAFPLSDVNEKTEFADYTAQYRFEGGMLHGTRHLEIKKREVPGTQRSIYTAFVKAVQEDMGRMMLLSGDFDADSPLVESRRLMKEGKNSEAIELLEKSIVSGTQAPGLEFALGSAYLRNSQEVKAVVQFKKLIGDKTSAALLNDIAYEYADANSNLGDAADYAIRAIADTSAETIAVKLNSATRADYLRMRLLAAEWDTLGWIKFRAGDAFTAHKFVEAAWMQMQSGIVGEHLAEIYEKLGKKAAADRVCRLALATFGMNDQSETKAKIEAVQKRLGIVKPKPEPARPGVFQLPNTGGIELSELRSSKVRLTIDLPDGAKSGIFAVMAGSDGKPAEVVLVSGDNVLKAEAEALADAKFPFSFPDERPVKILRKGLLSCSKYTKNCTFVLLLLSDPLSMLNTSSLE